jgi:hypothetical protein
MNLLTKVLTTLVLICLLSASVPAGEISCGVDGKAPCATSVPIEELPEDPEGAPATPEVVTWELIWTLLQGALSVF